MSYHQLQNAVDTAADGTATVIVNKDPITASRNSNDPYFDRHCIAIDPGTNTAGTITVTSTAIGAAAAESVFEDGSALVINLATSGEPFTRKLIDFPVENFIFTAAGMNGTTWDVTIVSGSGS